MRALVGVMVIAGRKGDGVSQDQTTTGRGSTHDATNSFSVLPWYASCPAATSGPYDGSK
jgi:hypothetical protein